MDRIEYELQYLSSDGREWLRGGNPTSDPQKARRNLRFVRSSDQQEIFSREWRLIKRELVETVLDWEV